MGKGEVYQLCLGEGDMGGHGVGRQIGGMGSDMCELFPSLDIYPSGEPRAVILITHQV